MSDTLQGGEQPAQTPPMTAKGITELEYARWRNQPVTLMFRQYLRDFRKDVIDVVLDQWLAGKIDLSTEHEMRGFANALHEASDMPFSTIALFYQQLDQSNLQSEGTGNDEGKISS